MKEPGKRRFLDNDWHSFNANGLSDDKMFEAVEGLHGRGVYGAVMTDALVRDRPGPQPVARHRQRHRPLIGTARRDVDVDGEGCDAGTQARARRRAPARTMARATRHASRAKGAPRVSARASALVVGAAKRRASAAQRTSGRRRGSRRRRRRHHHSDENTNTRVNTTTTPPKHSGRPTIALDSSCHPGPSRSMKRASTCAAQLPIL